MIVNWWILRMADEDVCRTERKSQPPPGHRVVLREAADDHGPVAHAGQAAEGHVLAGVHQAVVDFVRDDQQIMPRGDARRFRPCIRRSGPRPWDCSGS